MSELNKIAREYLESLGVEVPAVQDAAPKTFDTLVATGPKVKGWESASTNGKPIIRNGRKLLPEDLRRNKAVPVTIDRAKFDRDARGGYVPDELGEARRVQQATRVMIEQHIHDVKAERRAAEEYKDAREMWDAINFQPLPIAAEEVVAPPAWRAWPTGNEVRAAILVGILILSVIAFFVMRTP